MALDNLRDAVNQAISDFDGIKEEIEANGVLVEDAPTMDYPEKIRDIPSTIRPRAIKNCVALEPINANNLVQVKDKDGFFMDRQMDFNYSTYPKVNMRVPFNNKIFLSVNNTKNANGNYQMVTMYVPDNATLKDINITYMDDYEIEETYLPTFAGDSEFVFDNDNPNIAYLDGVYDRIYKLDEDNKIFRRVGSNSLNVCHNEFRALCVEKFSNALTEKGVEFTSSQLSLKAINTIVYNRDFSESRNVYLKEAVFVYYYNLTNTNYRMVFFGKVSYDPINQTNKSITMLFDSDLYESTAVLNTYYYATVIKNNPLTLVINDKYQKGLTKWNPDYVQLVDISNVDNIIFRQLNLKNSDVYSQAELFLDNKNRLYYNHLRYQDSVKGCVFKYYNLDNNTLGELYTPVIFNNYDASKGFYEYYNRNMTRIPNTNILYYYRLMYAYSDKYTYFYISYLDTDTDYGYTYLINHDKARSDSMGYNQVYFDNNLNVIFHERTSNPSWFAPNVTQLKMYKLDEYHSAQLVRDISEAEHIGTINDDVDKGETSTVNVWTDIDYVEKEDL